MTEIQFCGEICSRPLLAARYHEKFEFCCKLTKHNIKTNTNSVVNCTLRFRLKVSFEMEISEIIMETFTLGTAIGLNMTHNVSFCAESVNAAAWNRSSEVGGS